MPDWFVGTGFTILAAIIGAVLLFAAIALIGCVGFFARTGYIRASHGRWGGAVWRWMYSLFVGIAIIAVGLAAQFDWIIWLCIAGVIVAGFFGIFIVPGSGDG